MTVGVLRGWKILDEREGRKNMHHDLNGITVRQALIRLFSRVAVLSPQCPTFLLGHDTQGRISLKSDMRSNATEERSAVLWRFCAAPCIIGDV